jgi:hypothetical protein
MVICVNTVRHIIRNMSSVKTVTGCPMEAERAAVNPEEISAWFNRFSSIVDGTPLPLPREFVFNMDETGCSDHDDNGRVRVIARIDCSDPSVPVL